MKPIYKLIIAGLCLGLAVLTIGWTQIIQSITGPYGHTITDGTSGFTITGTTTMAYTAPDSVAAKKVIASTTAGDSVIIYTIADKPKIVWSMNGARDSIYISDNDFVSSGVWRFGGHLYTGGNVYASGNFYSTNYAPSYFTHNRAYHVGMYGNKDVAYLTALGYPDTTKGLVVDSTGFRIKASGSAHISGIYVGNATGWTLENTVDTNVISGITATSKAIVQMRAAAATLTAPLCCRTVVDTLFISCAAADTSAVRAGSVDYLIFK